MQTIRVLDLWNIGPNPLQIGVGSPVLPGTDVTAGTDITGTDITEDDDFVALFPGEGIIVLHPGRRLVVEEERVNLGQIENLRVRGALKVEVTTRTVSDLTSQE